MISKIDFVDDVGLVVIKLNDLMDEKNISISEMSKLANIKYETAKKYYFGENCYFSPDILAKFCFILNCDISDILVYIPSKEVIMQ